MLLSNGANSQKMPDMWSFFYSRLLALNVCNVLVSFFLF
jgi:hypothetical protein